MAESQPLPRDDESGESDPRLASVLASADQKHNSDEAAYRRLRPKPLELQLTLNAEQRQELATEKYLLDGFFKAKLQNADREIELTDVQMIRNLQSVAKHLVDRSKSRG